MLDKTLALYKHEVHVIADSQYSSSFIGVQVHELKMFKSRRNPLLLYKLLKLIKGISPNIIHAHANKAVGMVASLKPLLPSNSKLVATIHSVKKRVSPYSKFDSVIGVSAKVLEGLDNQEKHIIYNGVRETQERIKTRDYLLKQLGIPSDQKIFVSIGRLVPVKRFDILIKAFQSIENAHLILVGEGRERQKLEDLAKKLSLNNIHFLGHRTDNIEILSSADLCVISSEREGFSYVMAESLLSHTPVISTDVADMKLILPRDSVSSINEPASLQEVIIRALKDFESFNNSYEPVYEWASDNLGFDTMVEKNEAVYSNLIS
ncbi:Lipopolysaccharide core biosynthesis glycosyltransferase LpsD [Nymphon striatum]|nr:Lipopolysaccharide core biosynthesis glycosyltransferase LpsD [Nymphon striatum]